LTEYYNEIESIFLAIARLLDGQAPQGTRWHRELLAQVARPTTTRPAVLSSSLETRLTVYLAFRHYVRHSYAFTLDWARLEPLVRQLRPVHAMFHEEIEVFLNFVTRRTDES